MKKIIVITFLLSCLHELKAQQTIETILTEIEKNNKSIVAEKQQQEALKLSYRTGLNPDNPKVEYDHLPGRPDGAGTQQDFAITQGFDFPTSYSKRRNVSQQKTIQSDLEFASFRQAVLLDAKLLCLDLIYAEKLIAELTIRLDNANKLLEAIQKKTDHGESNVLDLNKVKLLQLDIKSQMARSVTDSKILRDKIIALNGGEKINLDRLQYPQQETLPGFDALDSLIESNDPVVKVVRQEAEITKQQLALTRSLTLPKLEGGYHQQSILGQKYAGVHVGLTIPLWENSNKIKSDQAKLSYATFKIQEHRNEHYYKNKLLYEEYIHWQTILADYRAVLKDGSNEQFLSRSLNAGQISVIEYLVEVKYFYEAISQSLEAERQLHRQLAMLYKFNI